MNKIIRTPYVAGSFYPATGKDIISQLEEIKAKLNLDFLKDIKPTNVFGCILPHAGHIYSGYQSLAFFELLKSMDVDFDSFVILHPLHRRGHLNFASDDNHFWETPIGKLKLDKEFIDAMEIELSSEMLAKEHSAEVILPYLQFYNFKDKMIIPIGIANQNPETSREITDKIKKAQALLGRKICLIASSDFSHFLSPEQGRQQDQLVIDALESKDIDSVYQRIIENDISVCGYGPIMSLMEYAKSRNPDYKTSILARGHSGEVNPSDSVVDYISILFYE